MTPSTAIRRALVAILTLSLALTGLAAQPAAAAGTIGSVDGAQGVRYGYDARVEILGTDGRLDIGDLTTDRVVLHARDGRSSRDIVPSWRNLFEDAYVAEDVSFVDAIRTGAPTEVTGTDGLRAVQIVNAGNESIRTGAVVELAG